MSETALLSQPSIWLLLALLVLCVLYPIGGRLIRGYLLRRFTAVDELPLLGVGRAQKMNGTAVVCGGSISGLLAARVCADHFVNVVLIDPELSEIQRTKPSTRIAQYDSLHGYLTFVLDGMRRLWPKFDAELKAAGGHVAAGDVKPFFGGTLLPAPYEEYAARAQPLPETMFARRPVLENVLRKLLLGAPSNVRTLVGSVRALSVRERDGTPRVGAVLVRGADGREVSLDEPELVIDCSGDSQAGLKWLKKCGYAMSPDIRLEYDQKLRYVTVTFTVDKALSETLAIPGGYENAGWIYTFVPDYNVGNAGFVLGKMDNDTMQLCCGGWGDVALPLEPDAIEGYVRSCKGREDVPEWLVDVLRELIKHGEPTFKPLKIRPCSYIRYQDVSGLPSNFVALGDSFLQLNPIYAQGCSKAMMGAITLNSLLAKVAPLASAGARVLPEDFSRSYFRHVGDHGDALWESTKTFDYGFSTTRPVKGETLQSGSFARWYLDMFIEAALKDKTCASAMWHVRMLLAPPTDMFTPSILWRVASHALSARLSRLHQ
ncbi:hypothetical protein BDW22DRAFT_810294 [Trametopsis cervina]|nr:hypothetical protein BDW22DRAFT_810294 [Trametopsis cervina]